MKLNLKRREFITNGRDPKVVVEYEEKHVGIRITEFQGVYDIGLAPNPVTMLEKTDTGTLCRLLAEALHCACEEVHELRLYQEEMEKDNEQRELEDQIADAERKAGWDPKP